MAISWLLEVQCLRSFDHSKVNSLLLNAPFVLMNTVDVSLFTRTTTVVLASKSLTSLRSSFEHPYQRPPTTVLSKALFMSIPIWIIKWKTFTLSDLKFNDHFSVSARIPSWAINCVTLSYVVYSSMWRVTWRGMSRLARVEHVAICFSVWLSVCRFFCLSVCFSVCFLCLSVLHIDVFACLCLCLCLVCNVDMYPQDTTEWWYS